MRADHRQIEWRSGPPQAGLSAGNVLGLTVHLILHTLGNVRIGDFAAEGDASVLRRSVREFSKEFRQCGIKDCFLSG